MPSPVDVSSEPPVETSVVLKHKRVGVFTGRDLAPYGDVRAGDCNFLPTHLDRAIEVEPVRQYTRLRLDEELISKGVNRIYFAVRLG